MDIVIAQRGSEWLLLLVKDAVTLDSFPTKEQADQALCRFTNKITTRAITQAHDGHEASPSTRDSAADIVQRLRDKE